MQKSGRGGPLEVLMFLWPALIFVGVWVYMEGGLTSAITRVDRLIVKGLDVLIGWVS